MNASNREIKKQIKKRNVVKTQIKKLEEERKSWFENLRESIDDGDKACCKQEINRINCHIRSLQVY